MTEITEQMDLCANCLNIETCCYCRNKKHPVHFCEEFTCMGPGESPKAAERLKRARAICLPAKNQGLFDDCGRPAARGR